jgi:hypothetical protein
MACESERPFINSVADCSKEEAQQKDRLLVLEICPQRFGFVVFEGPVRLLDWGLRNYRGRGAVRLAALHQRISILLQLYAPTALVMRRRDGISERARKGSLSAARTVRAAARMCSVKIHLVNTGEVRRFFSAHGCRTKHQIASLVANWFEELSWKLPPARRSWQPEQSNAAVFDAVATGITYFGRERRKHRETANSN